MKVDILIRLCFNDTDVVVARELPLDSRGIEQVVRQTCKYLVEVAGNPDDPTAKNLHKCVVPILEECCARQEYLEN